MDTRIKPHEEFLVRTVLNGRRQRKAWCNGTWPVRSMLAVAACFVALSGFAQVQWRHVYAETNSAPGSRQPTEYSRAVALDKAENVFVAATSLAPPKRITLLKLSPSGELLWARHFRKPGYEVIRGYENSGDPESFGLAVDGSGNAHLLVTSSGAGTGLDIVLLKYDPDGNLIWTARYDHSSRNEEARAIGVDLQANVYVTGCSKDANGRSVAITLKFDSSGQQLWAAVYQGRRPGYHAGEALTVDAFGNAYITGYTGGDVLTVKYDAAGRQVWARRHNGTPGLGDAGLAIVADPFGQVYVAGESQARGSRLDWITLKYSNAGQLRWAKRRNGGDSLSGATAIVRGEQGDVYVTGGGTVVKYSATGRAVWESVGLGGNPGAPMRLQLDAQGFLYYALTDFAYPNGGYFHVGQIEPTCGERLWTASLTEDTPRSDHVAAMAVAPSGSLVVSGSSIAEDSDVATVKFQPPDHRDTPRVSITAVDPSATEGGRRGTTLGAFAVSRTGPTNEPLAVGFHATGSAKPGLDYLPALQAGFGVVTIPAGSNYALIPIEPVNDRLWERTETVRFTLYRGSGVSGGYLLGPQREAVIRIFDNERSGL